MKPTDDERDDPTSPARWLSRPAGDGDVEDRLVALVRAGAPAAGLGAGARARVWSRLTTSKRRSRTHAGLRWSVAAGVLLTSSAVVAAVTAYSWWRAAPATLAPVDVATQPRDRTRHGIGARLQAREAAGISPPPAPPVLLAPDVLGSPVTLPLRSSDVARTDRRAERATSAEQRRLAAAVPALDVSAASGAPSSPAAAVDVAPPAPTTPEVATSDASFRRLEPPPAQAPSIPADVASDQSGGGAPTAGTVAPARPPVGDVEASTGALAAEARLLTEALNRLRQQRDGAGALATLDAYAARFPAGTLRGEAARARVDALLVLGRDDDALAVLRSLSLLSQGRDEELRVIRGELSAPSSCGRAIADFDAVLADAPTPPLAERALHGRATCRARLGDREGAFSDWREYLRRYPQGRFAGEARLGLESKTL